MEVMNQLKPGVVLIVIMILLGLGFYIGKRQAKENAVKKGYAQYNSITGHWEWKPKKEVVK